MISLIQIKKYIQQQKMATQAMVSGYFKLDLELAHDLLLHLERCGKLQRIVPKANCDGCQQCDKPKTVWFAVV